ncbi:DUF2269 family protein [Roseateles violae]|uniref:DUF2269 domain-containing protein n=1 Tax=Roseateles violae TaxID=3058042 RepID=A0ABT8DTT6_9BURK|nr:DUF2269 domain-containing protein [Pelomonas sp. PFR6]MDN3921533.1 DUF2269 domain-containing protein [Pelomonas sp. PFR6]
MSNEYLIVKWLHILSSTFLFGTGVGSAYYLFFISLTRDTAAVAAVTARLVKADWLFTATTIVFQPLSGLYLMHLAGWPITQRWILWSFVLLAIAAACWLPVVWLQMRMRDLAADAKAKAQPLPPRYQRLFLAWIALGFPALFAFLAVFYLMVAKPV